MTGYELRPLPPPHTPLRPLWICRRDGQPWPCAEARLALTRDYQGRTTDLCVYLGLSLARAIRDLYQLNPYGCPTPEVIHDRFIGWVPVRRHRPSPADRAAPADRPASADQAAPAGADATDLGPAL